MNEQTIVTEVKNEITRVENTIQTDIPKVEFAVVRLQIWIKNNPVKSALALGFIFGFILGTLV